MTDDERLAKLRYVLGVLIAFMAGWQLAPQVAATNWYRPITSILGGLVALGLLFLGFRLLSKKPSKNGP